VVGIRSELSLNAVALAGCEFHLSASAIPIVLMPTTIAITPTARLRLVKLP
jgi:hypothetical protein